MDTLGSKLKEDPRVEEAIKILEEVVTSYQNQITGVKPAIPELKIDYQALLNSFATLRGGKLYYPYLGSGIGKGPLVELMDGSIKYDFISGIGPHVSGHSDLELLASGVKAALQDTVMQGNLQQNSETVALCELLTRTSKLEHCFLTTSGAMANDNALKIAFQKKYPACRVLAFEHCFMGRSLGTAQITDKAAYREGLPHTLDVDYIPFYDYNNPEKSTENTLNALKEHLKRYPKQHAVMCLELIQGEGGFYPGTREFFRSLVDVLKENGILILADEIQTFGRTESLFGFHHFGLEGDVDLCTIGKLSQVCATLFKASVAPRPGLLSQTFTGSTSSIFSSLYIIKKLLSGGYYGKDGKIAELHKKFTRHLEALPLIKGPFGCGGMIAFTPFDGSKKRTEDLTKALFENGIISFFAGQDPTRIRFLPPLLAMNDHDLDEAFAILKRTIDEVARCT